MVQTMHRSNSNEETTACKFQFKIEDLKSKLMNLAFANKTKKMTLVKTLRNTWHVLFVEIMVSVKELIEGR